MSTLLTQSTYASTCPTLCSQCDVYLLPDVQPEATAASPLSAADLRSDPFDPPQVDVIASAAEQPQRSLGNRRLGDRGTWGDLAAWREGAIGAARP